MIKDIFYLLLETTFQAHLHWFDSPFLKGFDIISVNPVNNSKEKGLQLNCGQFASKLVQAWTFTHPNALVSFPLL
jgi:hypothetical protein